MYYINAAPNGAGNHGNPQSRPYPGSVVLPDELLGDYIAAKGFVTFTVEEAEDGGVPTVTSLEIDQDAYDAYVAEHPTPAPEPTQLDRIEAQIMYTALVTDTLLEEV